MEKAERNTGGQYVRTQMLLGPEAMKRLHAAHVAIFGLGGVGGYVAEALARSGIGAFDLIDSDTVALSNLNRQILASHDTIGRDKVEVMRERILSINPDAQVRAHKCFYLPENADSFRFDDYTYVADAIDTVTAKIELILRAKEAGTPIISCMGTGNRLDPSLLKIKDLFETKGDPLARVMRRELRKRGVTHLEVVCSSEEPVSPLFPAGSVEENTAPRRSVPGSTAFVPPTAGLLMASRIVMNIAKPQPKN